MFSYSAYTPLILGRRSEDAGALITTTRMPYLTFSDAPPPSQTIGAPDKNVKAAQTVPEKAPTESVPPEAITTTAVDTSTATNGDRPPNAYPVVQLDVDALSDAVAARLAASLLAHVLFLKNQVPL